MKWTLLQLIKVGRKNEVLSSNKDSGRFDSTPSDISILPLLSPHSLWMLKLIGCISDSFSAGKNVGCDCLRRGRFAGATGGGKYDDGIGCSRSLRMDDIFLFLKQSVFLRSFPRIEYFCARSPL